MTDNKDREYAKERLTSSELKLVETLPHTLDEVLRQERISVMQRETSRDIFWGFYSDGAWAKIRRTVYKILVHPILKKSKKEI